MGSPAFATTILDKLFSKNFPILAVFTKPDKPSGRGQEILSPPVAVYARKKKLPLYQPQTLRDENVIKEFQALRPDYTIVAAYGKILPTSIIAAAHLATLNVHASLLPQYRGAAPINHALLDGCRQTGISIMRIEAELDAGPVYTTQPISITDADDAPTLTEKLSHLGADTLIDTLQKIEEGLMPRKQDHAHATYAPKLTPKLSPIDWHRPARAIFNQIRALKPWPIASTAFRGKKLLLHAGIPLSEVASAPPGTIVHIGKNGITVTTGEGCLLITTAQLASKRQMNAFDLANGLRLKPGDKLT